MRSDIRYYMDIDENGNYKLSYSDRIFLYILIVGMFGSMVGTLILSGYTVYNCIFGFL
jgi:hypothetical protein